MMNPIFGRIISSVVIAIAIDLYREGKDSYKRSKYKKEHAGEFYKHELSQDEYHSLMDDIHAPH